MWRRLAAFRCKSWLTSPSVAAALLAGLVFSPLLLGIEPVGGDPERLYRPLKAELARALQAGTLPWWSDRFGLGLPLVAESHAAAFYPPNGFLYRFIEVDTAYRLAMWAHHVLMAVGTCLYGSRLGLGRAGAVLAALAFTLCGFQAIHASHEVFYHALAYLPWALVLADIFAETGRPDVLAGLALVLGTQWTLGHFQIQTWTAMLVVLTGGARALGTGRAARRLAALILAVLWGGLIAALQLGPSWELARVVGQTSRPIGDLMFYSFPPAHWAQLVAPRLFLGIEPMDPYWFGQQTSGYEACFHVGTITLILAGIGAFSRNRALTIWKILAPIAFALATMPRWWPQGYTYLLMVPGFGLFRCPARYTAISSLGLALLGGAGLDHAISKGRARLGLALSTALIVAGFAWIAWLWQLGPAVGFQAAWSRSAPGAGVAAVLERGLFWDAGAAIVGLVVVALWRRGLLPSAVLIGLAVAQLAALYYQGPIEWGRDVRLPESSRVLTLLGREPGVGRIGGVLENLPTRAGLATAAPYVGFELPEPSKTLKLIATNPAAWNDPIALRWLARCGVTHLVNVVDDSTSGSRPSTRTTLVFRGRDPELSRASNRRDSTIWEVFRLNESPGPDVAIANRYRGAPSRRELLNQAILGAADASVAWLPPSDIPRDNHAEPSAGRVRDWDGRAGTLEHSGPCLLTLNRTAYPGWRAAIDGCSAPPILEVDGGIQAIRLDGSGSRRVTVMYRPTNEKPLAILSAVAALAAVLVAVLSRLGRLR